MDPFSITVGVVGLVDVSLKTVASIREYMQRVKNAPKDMAQLSQAIDELQCSLQRVVDMHRTTEYLIDKDRSKRFFDAGNQHERTLKSLKESLEEMIRKQKPSRPASSSFRRFWHGKTTSIQWTLRSKGFLDRVKDVKEYREIIDRVLLDDIWLNSKNRKRDELLSWVSPQVDQEKHDLVVQKRCQNTGSWFLTSGQFKNWRTSTSCGFLWLHGKPGSGKSFLASSIIDALGCGSHQQAGSSTKAQVAFFYFDFNDRKKLLTDRMVRSLIRQLAIMHPRAEEELRMLFELHRTKQSLPSFEEFRNTLQKIVKILQVHQDTFIVLDALDECEDRDQMLKSVSDMVGWKKARILLLSRKEWSIEKGLKELAAAHGGEISSIQGRGADQDIQTFIRDRLGEDGQLQQWTDQRRAIETRLMDKADGMFRWVECQLISLGRCCSVQDLHAALESLPSDLDGTYERILSSIHADYRPRALNLLTWLAFSAGPLRIRELAEAMAIDIETGQFKPSARFREPCKILEFCPGMVDTFMTTGKGQATDEEQEVRLAHFSVKEYLMSDRILSSPLASYCSLREDTAHGYLARATLVYLRQLSLSPTKEDISQYPLAAYSSMHWTTHARIATAGVDGPSVDDTLMRLIDEMLGSPNNRRTWLRIWDPEEWWYSRQDNPPQPLCYASAYGLTPYVKTLITKGANVNTDSPLTVACWGNHVAVVQLLLEAGASPNVRRIGGYGNPLAVACTKGHVAVVQLLLDAGADIFMADALGTARRNSHVEVARLLLGKWKEMVSSGKDGAPCASEFLVPQLQEACAVGQTGFVRLIVEENPGIIDINQEVRESLGNVRFLHIAAEQGHDGVVRILLGAGADADAEDEYNRTALVAAVVFDHGRTVRTLLEHGANVQLGGLLEMVIDGGYTGVICLFIEHKAEINDVGNLIQMAALVNRTDIVHRLIDNGARFDGNDVKVQKAIKAAASRNAEEMVRLLLSASVNISAKDDWVRNNMLCAGLMGNEGIVRLLGAAGEND